jgi:1-acyl-sn-glycerol-3-phosphate acyltransferase
MWRRMLMGISARCLRWFYREQRVVHAERMPATGPVLFVGNHPNDLPDVLFGFLATPRPVRYLATVAAATGWLAGKSYQWLGVIPVARLRDVRKMQAAGADVVAINRAATDAVASALAAGQVVGAFPEGGVRDVCSLADFKTGVASMLLKYIDAGTTNDVTVVPFGIQYEAPRTFGSDVVTVLGHPFSLRDWQRAQPADGSGAAALTRALWQAVHDVTRNAPNWEVARQRDELVAAVAAVLAPTDPLAAAPTFVPRAERALADLSSVVVADVNQIERLVAASALLAQAVERAGGIGTSAVDHARLLFALDLSTHPAPPPTAVLWLGGPAAAIGAVVHAPAFWVVHQLARRLAKARADVVALSFVPGLFVILAGYALTGFALLFALNDRGMSWWWSLPVLFMLPKFGDLMIAWRAGFAARRLVRRVRSWSSAECAALRDAAAVIRAEWGRLR